MTTPRIYFPGMQGEETTVELEGDNLNYIRNVLRLKTGENVILFDGTGYEYETVIKDLAPRSTVLEIIRRESVTRPDIAITLAQSLAKSAKMDFIIQKATELGATRVIPFTSSRSIPKLSESKSSARVSRWRKIAIEASKQCRRSIIPEVIDILSYDEMLQWPGGKELKIILWEEEQTRDLKKILRDTKWSSTGDFFVVVGPEGGFSRGEVEKALSFEFLSATLGKYILRTETAPLTILAILQYERGIFSTGDERKG